MTDRRWTIGLINGFRLERDDEVVALFYDRMQDLLLAYLALHPDRPHLRGSLARTMWPDRTEQLARNRLSESLHLLRIRLHELGAPDDLVRADRHTLRLDPGVRTDVRDFELRFAEALEKGLAADSVPMLEGLVAEYGDGLLPDLSVEWVQVERERLEGVYSQLVEALGALGEGHVIRATKDMSAGELARRHRRARLLRTFEIGGAGAATSLSEAVDSVLEELGLASGAEVRALQRVRCERYVAMVAEAESQAHGPDRRKWAGLLAGERQNLVEALEWAIEAEEAQLAAPLAGSLWPYWYAGGLEDEGRLLLERVLSMARLPETPAHAKVLNGAGALALHMGEAAIAEDRLNAALAMSRQLAYEEGVARALGNLATVAYRAGQYERARRGFTESIEVARRLRDQGALADVLGNASLVEIADGDYETAADMLAERLALCDGLDDKIGRARTLTDMGTVAQFAGDYQQARSLTEQARRCFEEEGDPRGAAAAALSLGHILQQQGDFDGAGAQYGHSLAIARSLSDMRGTGEALRYLAMLSADTGDTARAVELNEVAIQMLESASDARGVAKARVALEALEGVPAQDRLVDVVRREHRATSGYSK